MYSNKENVNILTSLLIAFGVDRAVVCPGSRNSPIVHNLCECRQMECYPVTDERSAGFFAVGLAESLDAPVAVCVTSGSALLNLAPAVAEAYYRNVRLIVISADRPPQWIGQSDGQTIVQPAALRPHVRKSVSLPEPRNDEERWFCNRLVNEALNENRRRGGAPVHINVPISEPLFEYDVPALPRERVIEVCDTPACQAELERLLEDELRTAHRPAIVLGQMPPGRLGNIEKLEARCLVLREKLAGYGALLAGELPTASDDMKPDMIIFMGGTIVDKNLKNFLRNCRGARSVLIDERGEIRDTFMNLAKVIEASPADALAALERITDRLGGEQFARKWRAALGETTVRRPLDYSHEWAVARLFEHLPQEVEIVCANSTAVRLANRYSDRYIFVNRGVNGIEGTLSTAVGHAAADRNRTVCCIIGDLSFFYDQNALWNQNLGRNLRIILLNNHGGGIFRQLPGLEHSPFRDRMIAAAHSTSAEGVCLAHKLEYLEARNKTQFDAALESFFNDKQRSALLEVFTETK